MNIPAVTRNRIQKFVHPMPPHTQVFLLRPLGGLI
ncbi:hypothetical protein FH603_1249 [Spirosoma sp. LMG 31447]|uniref:Uncharacterized protein n=1 Tax=Spirosoma utsteinense TaxID=2585773 RepID=A0ABR6W2J0_9BACT|nr:hypothetical protein [Spirosoma utsteinense]